MMNDNQRTPCWHIWSGEYGMWLRRGNSGLGEGYTSFLGQAGKWARSEAEAMTRHCGPEKKIALVPDPYGADAEVVQQTPPIRKLGGSLQIESAQRLREERAEILRDVLKLEPTSAGYRILYDVALDLRAKIREEVCNG